MNDRHYLLKVMGLSAVPRLVTFGLKLVSFPLMVRELGATQFGVVVYIGAIAAVLESFVDFGVSSATGKELAVARETGCASLRTVIQKWSRLQATVALIGLGPLLGVTYLVASASSQIEFSLSVLVILVLASWVAISLNFVRACLSSVLAFKSLGALDCVESVLRAAGWIAVAYYFPTTVGFAWASLITVGCASVVGVALLGRFLSKNKVADTASGLPGSNSSLHIRYMVKESLSFLWLRLVTRTFQSIPVVLFGRMFGSEVVGVVGAFSRIVELINFPFAVIGNALAVRAPGVLVKGTSAVRALWDAASRFIAVAVMLSVTLYLGTELMAKLLLPDSPSAGTLMSILSFTVITTAIASVIPPMSDYVGALRSRNVLLTFFTFFQVPVIWLGAKGLGVVGAISAYVLVLTLMNWGYVRIALSVFFPAARYHLRHEVRYFLAITVAALLLTFFLHRVLPLDQLSPLHSYSLHFIDVVIFWLSVLAGLALHQPAKKFFLTKIFFDFQVRTS